MDSDLVRALRLRGVDVLTAHDAGLIGYPDGEHLAFAAADGRALCSFNVADFMKLHLASLADGRHHAGIILAQQQRYNVGELMRRLLRLVGTKPAEHMRDSVEFLSRWG
ncbi:MAG: hypothetical protein QOF61_960 [Acidobacteriota bacterium]|nr:hypothetical protein [Acidobacteriota bacterium]